MKSFIETENNSMVSEPFFYFSVIHDAYSCTYFKMRLIINREEKLIFGLRYEKCEDGRGCYDKKEEEITFDDGVKLINFFNSLPGPKLGPYMNRIHRYNLPDDIAKFLRTSKRVW